MPSISEVASRDFLVLDDDDGVRHDLTAQPDDPLFRLAMSPTL
jgi:hypothetical protein